MAAWQRILDSKWFDPATKDFTSTEPIEITGEVINTMGMQGILALLPPLLGVHSAAYSVLKNVMRSERKDNNYGR